MAAPKYQKSVELDLSKKMEVLILIKKGIPYSKISDQFEIAKCTVTNIKKSREAFVAAWEANQSTTAKRTSIRKNKNYDINTLMIIYFGNARSRNIPAHIDVDELLDFNSNIPTEDTLEGEDWEEQIFKNYVANVAEEERFEPTLNEADECI